LLNIFFKNKCVRMRKRSCKKTNSTSQFSSIPQQNSWGSSQ